MRARYGLSAEETAASLDATNSASLPSSPALGFRPLTSSPSSPVIRHRQTSGTIRGVSPGRLKHGSQDANNGNIIPNTPSMTQVSGFSHSLVGNSTKGQIRSGYAYAPRGAQNSVASMLRVNSPTRLVSAEIASSVDVPPACTLQSSSSGFFPAATRPSSPQPQQQQQQPQQLQQQHVFQEEVRRELQAHAMKLAQVEEAIRSDMRVQTTTVMESVMSKQREFASRMQEIVAAEEMVIEQVRARSVAVSELEVRMVDMAMSVSALRGDFDKFYKSQSNPITMSTLQEDAEQEFLARLDEVLEREATARRQLEQKISNHLNSVMVQLVGKQANSLVSLVNTSANCRRESAVDDIQSGNVQFQCRLLEQQVTTLCAAMSSLMDKCPESSEESAAYIGDRGPEQRSISFEGDSFDGGNTTPDLLTATSVFANVAMDEPEQLCTAASQHMVNREGTDSITQVTVQQTQPMKRLLTGSRPQLGELEEGGHAAAEMSNDGKHFWQKHARSAG